MTEAPAPIWRLAWKFPYVSGTAVKRKDEKKKLNKRNKKELYK